MSTRRERDRRRKPWTPREAPGCRVESCPMRAPYCTQHRNTLRLLPYAARNGIAAFRASLTPEVSR